MQTITLDEFVNREIATWGFDYVEDLFDKGYEPTYLHGKGWMWLLQPSRVSNLVLNQ